MTPKEVLDQLGLQPFQQRTALYAHQRMFEEGQTRFLIADEVGLGKTKVALGLIALATLENSGNVLYLASSGHIVGQNLDRLETNHVKPYPVNSLSVLAEQLFKKEHELHGKIIGLTPIKDLRADHFGSVHERGLLYRLLLPSYRSLMNDVEVKRFFQGTRVNDETFGCHCVGRVPRSLREAFKRQLGEDNALVQKLRDAKLRKKHKREIVGGLRALLALCALEKLNPALVVVDEIQRFSDILLKEPSTPQDVID